MIQRVGSIKAGLALSALVIGMGLTATVEASSAKRAEQRQPNILFFLADDIGKEWVSVYGADLIETPNLDKLAAEGMLFDNVYATPQCTPSRASLLTGQYPFRTGWINHWDTPRWGHAYLDPNLLPSAGNMLQDAGYKTAAAGKWQLDDYRRNPDAMAEHGFDHYTMWTGYESNNPSSASRYYDPSIHTEEGTKVYKGKFGPDIFSDRLLEFMDENQDNPWYAYYPMVLPHDPFGPTPHEPERVNEDGTPKTARQFFKSYVRYMDYIVGKMVNHLEETGQLDNTIIVWTGDNGTSRLITGYRDGVRVPGGKQTTRESGVNVPFIVSGAGVPKGVVTDALVDFTDLLPTFVDLGGGKMPESFEFDGRSFADLIQGRADDSDREWILAMGGLGNARVSENGVENEWYFRDRVLRDKRYKVYIEAGQRRRVERMFDLQNDPYELNDIYDSDEPHVVEARERLHSVIDSFPRADADHIYTKKPLDPKYDHEQQVFSGKWKLGRPNRFK